MSLLDRLFGWLPRLLRPRSPAPRPVRLPLDAAWRPTAEPAAPELAGREVAVEPALGAAAGQAGVVEAWEAAELAGAEPAAVAEPETVDAGGIEARPVDAGFSDAGFSDAGLPDAELRDEGLLEDEDVFEEEELAADLAGDDAPGDEASDLDARLHARLLATPDLRGAAEREALSGEHRIGLADPGGPGTLAEALIRLEREGVVTCELGEDEAGSPVLVYRPVAAAPATVH